MESDNIVIRPFRTDDADRVEAFFDRMKGQAAFFFNLKDVNRKRARTFFDNTAKDIDFFLAEDTDTGDMVGYVFLRGMDRSVVWLGIAVDERCRGCHLGSRLLDFIHDYAQKAGKGGILLYTHPANTHAQALYHKMGYERIGTHQSGEYLFIRRF